MRDVERDSVRVTVALCSEVFVPNESVRVADTSRVDEAVGLLVGLPLLVGDAVRDLVWLRVEE